MLWGDLQDERTALPSYVEQFINAVDDGVLATKTTESLLESKELWQTVCGTCQLDALHRSVDLAIVQAELARTMGKVERLGGRHHRGVGES